MICEGETLTKWLCNREEEAFSHVSATSVLWLWEKKRKTDRDRKSESPGIKKKKIPAFKTPQGRVCQSCGELFYKCEKKEEKKEKEYWHLPCEGDCECVYVRLNTSEYREKLHDDGQHPSRHGKRNACQLLRCFNIHTHSFPQALDLKADASECVLPTTATSAFINSAVCVTLYGWSNLGLQRFSGNKMWKFNFFLFFLLTV